MFHKDKLQELFGKSWSEALSEYISGKDFYQLACKITELRKTTEIYPSKENIFRAFRECPYDKLKISIIGQDPYPTASYADGLAFSNSLSRDISPTLKIILKEVDNCYPENIDRMDYGKLDPQDLSRWSKQGVGLFNIALTIEKGKVASHLDMWKNFTIEVFKALNRKSDIVVVLLGKEVKTYSKLINNPTITVLEYSHPSIHLYGGEGFVNKGIFKEINKQLLARNLKEVVW